MASFPPSNWDPNASAAPKARQFEMGPWVQYSPTFTTSGAAPTLNNGTTQGRYRRHGTTLHLQARLVVGSTTSLGNGAVRLGIPTGVSPGPMQQVGVAFWFDASTGILTRGVTILDPGATYAYPWLGDTTSPSDSSGLGSGDSVAIGGTFEIAA